jgi:hypothetical protein
MNDIINVGMVGDNSVEVRMGIGGWVKNPISIEDQFTYHPPKTPERIKAHETINAATIVCAKALVGEIRDEVWQQKVLDALQYARMLANQAVTFESLPVSYSERRV